MKRKLLSTSLWGILTFSLFYSCRTDSATTEQTITSKEKIAAFERFEKENNIIKPIASNNQSTSSAKYVSYSYPFALIIYNFLQAHPDYAKQIEKEVGTIRLDAVSQTFGNTEKSVIFPVTNNEGKVVAIWAGVINENRDYVTFYSLNRNTQEINSIKTAFQNYYDQKESRLTNNAIASIKGLNPIAGAQVPPKDPPVKEKEIPEVVINVPAVPERDIDPWWYKGPGGINYGTNPGGGMSGGSDVHGGGGGSTPNANQEIINNLKDYPCAQKLLQDLKTDLNNDLAKLIVNTLGDDNKSVQVNFFGEEFDDSQLNGQTRRVDKIGDKIMKFDIALSKDMLQNATQEYVLATMYHEFVHAYLGYQFKTLGADVYHAKYPYLESYNVGGVTKFRFKTGDHQAFTPFVNMIADALRTYNPNIPSKVATALAMKGLIDEESPNPYLPDGADLINQQERKSDKYSQGTKCAKQ